MKTLCSAPCTKQLTTEHYPEPDETITHLRLLLYHHCRGITHLRLWLTPV